MGRVKPVSSLVQGQKQREGPHSHSGELRRASKPS